MFIIGLRPKQLIEQNYPDKHQGRIEAGHENNMCIDPYPTAKQQI